MSDFREFFLQIKTFMAQGHRLIRCCVRGGGGVLTKIELQPCVFPPVSLGLNEAGTRTDVMEAAGRKKWNFCLRRFSSASSCQPSSSLPPHPSLPPSLLLSLLQPAAELWPGGICSSATSAGLALSSPSMPRERRASLCVAPLWLPPLSAPALLGAERSSALRSCRGPNAIDLFLGSRRSREGLKSERWRLSGASGAPAYLTGSPAADTAALNPAEGHCSS